MPRIASLLVLVLGLTTVVVDVVAAQTPPQGTAPANWGERPVSPPQIPWTGATTAARASEPPQLLPTAYQQSAPREVRPAVGQQPLPLSPQATGAAAPLGNKKFSPLVSGAASLGIVLGLFLLVVWSVRRGMPKGAGLLPTDAVEVLGRAPIAGRQDVHLVHCGNKIVLVSVSATSVETLTEISDPEEVERLLELCRYSAAPASAWQQLLGRFGQLGRGVDMQGRRPDSIDFRHLEVGNHPRA